MRFHAQDVCVNQPHFLPIPEMYLGADTTKAAERDTSSSVRDLSTEYASSTVYIGLDVVIRCYGRTLLRLYSQHSSRSTSVPAALPIGSG